MFKYIIIIGVLFSCGVGGVFGQGYFGKRVLVSYNFLTNNIPDGGSITHFFSTSSTFRTIQSLEVEYLWASDVSFGVNRYTYSTTFETFKSHMIGSNIFQWRSEEVQMNLEGLGYGVFVKGYPGSNAPFGFFGKLQLGYLQSKATRLDAQGEIARGGDVDIRGSIGHQAHIFRNLFLVVALDGAYVTDFSGVFSNPPPLTNLELNVWRANLIQHAVNLRVGLIVPIF